MLKAIKVFIVNTLEYNFAPFAVVNTEFNKVHYCWNWKDALEWLSAYDAQSFGKTLVLGFNREVIGFKSI